MLLYYLALPFIYLISSLPYKALYAFSDFLYLIVFHVFGYRRKVVEDNLRKSFPEKSPEEIIKISKRYYHYLCDLILETFKKFTITEKESKERCILHNTELFKRLKDENRSVILLMGHYGNWEMAGSSFSLAHVHQLYVIYKPLANEYFENLMCKSRTKYGTKLIKMENTLKDILNNKNNCAAYAFIADQTPSNQNAYWTNFLNQDTAMFTGAEKLAKKLNFPVVFINIVRVKRGYYEIFPEMLCEDPKSSKENEIIELFVRKLEKEIIKMPETWLWSHRRWKQKRPETVKDTTQKI
jgi:KDO2-lipid IV(A) lauroyltransferase